MPIFDWFVLGRTSGEKPVTLRPRCQWDHLMNKFDGYAVRIVIGILTIQIVRSVKCF